MSPVLRNRLYLFSAVKCWVEVFKGMNHFRYINVSGGNALKDSRLVLSKPRNRELPKINNKRSRQYRSR